MVVKAQEHPDVVRHIYRLLQKSKAAANEPMPQDGIDKLPLGMSQVWRHFEIAARYAWQQHILARELKVDELFDATTRPLD